MLDVCVFVCVYWICIGMVHLLVLVISLTRVFFSGELVWLCEMLCEIVDFKYSLSLVESGWISALKITVLAFYDKVIGPLKTGESFMEEDFGLLEKFSMTTTSGKIEKKVKSYRIAQDEERLEARYI